MTHLLIILCFIAGKPKDCKDPLPGNMGLLFHKDKIGIVKKVSDTWNIRLYFNGTGWSTEYNDALMIPKKDTCRLKAIFFASRVK